VVGVLLGGRYQRVPHQNLVDNHPDAGQIDVVSRRELSTAVTRGDVHRSSSVDKRGLLDGDAHRARTWCCRARVPLFQQQPRSAWGRTYPIGPVGRPLCRWKLAKRVNDLSRLVRSVRAGFVAAAIGVTVAACSDSGEYRSRFLGRVRQGPLLPAEGLASGVGPGHERGSSVRWHHGGERSGGTHERG